MRSNHSKPPQKDCGEARPGGSTAKEPDTKFAADDFSEDGSPRLSASSSISPALNPRQLELFNYIADLSVDDFPVVPCDDRSRELQLLWCKKAITTRAYLEIIKRENLPVLSHKDIPY